MGESETWFAELKRYVRFEARDEAALHRLFPFAAPEFRRIAEDFYTRLDEHAEAKRVFGGPEQVARLKGTLCEWMRLLLTGPWDEAYYALRARIGRMHVEIGLPQRYMFGAMDVIRIDLMRVAESAYPRDEPARTCATAALQKIIDLELAIMLETFREAFVDKVQHGERLEKAHLTQRLAISEARYAEVVENAEALIMAAEPDGRIILFNRRCEALTGLDRAAVTGRSWLEVMVSEPDREPLRARLDGLLAGHRVPPYEGPILTIAGDRRLVRWHFTTLPANGDPLLCAIGMDVTDERELQQRARRNERLASLGTMAAGLAHEIRNPLNAAHLQLTLLRRRLVRPTGVDVEGALGTADIVRTELQRLAGLVEEFLQFARPQPLRLCRADLRVTTESVIRLLAPVAEQAGVAVALHPGPPVLAEFEDERMKQVILNLIRNAVEAVSPGGHVHVRLRAEPACVAVEVEDDGEGLCDPAASIFEPFYTTKANGTGLGLAIVHRIVNDHGGQVGVESRPGRTVFRVELPSLAGPA
jgi:PAS domain S-box-containing protein